MESHVDALDNLLASVEEQLGIAPSDVDADATYDPGYALIYLYVSTLEHYTLSYDTYYSFLNLRITSTKPSPILALLMLISKTQSVVFH